MNLCKYKNIFGVPNEGLHKYKIGGIAVIDLIFTIVGAYFIHNYFKLNFIVTLVSLLIIGEIAHYLFCVDTPIINYIKNICN